MIMTIITRFAGLLPLDSILCTWKFHRTDNCWSSLWSGHLFSSGMHPTTRILHQMVLFLLLRCNTQRSARSWAFRTAPDFYIIILVWAFWNIMIQVDRQLCQYIYAYLFKSAFNITLPFLQSIQYYIQKKFTETLKFFFCDIQLLIILQ